MRFNLQRFAEDEPVIDVIVSEPSEPEELVEPEVVEPEPHPISHNVPMPSGVSGEAWRNVEELLVTLSNNTRVNMAEIVSLIRNGDKRESDVMERIEQSLSQMNTTMSEFKTLLESAIVDEPKQEPHPAAEVAKRGGYLSRRNRG